MVEHQLEIARQSPHSRHLRKPPKPPERFIPASLCERHQSIVIACGEASAWPRDVDAPAAELVQWVATRLHTQERFEAVMRPRHELSPACEHHLQIERERILSGPPFAEFVRRWTAFLRPGDLVCTWGNFGANLAARDGVPLGDRIDLRPPTLRYLGLRAGASAACARLLGVEPPAPWCEGRAGLRIAELEAIVRHLLRQKAACRSGADGSPA